MLSDKEFVAKVGQLVEPVCDAEGTELVHVEYQMEPGGKVLRLYIDKPDGISLDEFLRRVDENMNREADELLAIHTAPGAKDFWDFSDPVWGEGWNNPGPSDPSRCPPSCR